MHSMLILKLIQLRHAELLRDAEHHRLTTTAARRSRAVTGLRHRSSHRRDWPDPR
ncbi:hypothetical protein [Sphaerisporangium perillae]|uniref:hypothetical protein n=1 Tax=Sphaerisporangium perillae TaxID=2935860 RepID=UPI002010B38D|nr:hypothetical protein [Sphaerisporangium perillae]